MRRELFNEEIPQLQEKFPHKRVYKKSPRSKYSKICKNVQKVAKNHKFFDENMNKKYHLK